VEAVPEGPQNPYGNAFIAVETELLTESAAQRVADPLSSRIWKIKNPASRHPATGVRPAPIRSHVLVLPWVLFTHVLITLLQATVEGDVFT
jgi:Copper amine oxidase, enzyme domain